MTQNGRSDTLACRIERNVDLKKLSRWRIGGTADYFAEPRNTSELAALLGFCRNADLPFFILGDSTNTLFDDVGYRGLIIRVGRYFSDYSSSEDGIVTAGAGIWLPNFVRRLIDDGLSGAEHAIGIPGTLGGLVVMNGGSRRLSISDNIISVQAMDEEGQILSLSKQELGFAYRRSALQERNLVIVSAKFHFQRGDSNTMRRHALQILSERRRKFPRNKANCGSVFASDPALYEHIGPPGLAIEKLGLKGLASGDAQISTEHANFIVNRGNASSQDILRLIEIAQIKVERATGIRMRVEIGYLPPHETHERGGRQNGICSSTPRPIAKSNRIASDGSLHV